MKTWHKLLFLLVLALCVIPANASVTLVQSQSGTCSGVNNCSVSLPSSTTAGNFLIFATQWGAQTGTFTACDGASCSTTCSTTTDTFSAVPSNPVSDGVGGGNEVEMQYTIATGTVTNFTYCVSGGGSHSMRMGVYEYSATNGWQSTPLDTSNTASNLNNVTTANTGSVTPAATGELIFAVIEWNGTPAASSITVAGTGMTEQPTSNGTSGNGWAATRRGDGCDNTNSGTSATNCTFNWTTGSAWAGTVAVFKPTVGGGGATCSTSIILLGVGCKP